MSFRENLLPMALIVMRISSNPPVPRRSVEMNSHLMEVIHGERERALDLLKKTEQICLVARALDIPLRFEPQLEVSTEVSF